MGHLAVLFAQEGVGGILPFLPILLLLGVFYFLILRPQKQDQVRRAEMFRSLKKNDRVVTSSGIYGVVTNVEIDKNEVTLRVDETSNTKLRVTLTSIAKVLGETPEEKK